MTGEDVQGERLVEMLQGPVAGGREGVRGGLWQRPGDVLRLAAVAVWCGDQFAGDLVGGCRAQVLAHEVQAQVDPGGHAGGGQYLSVVDVEDVAVHAHLRVEVLQVVGAGPVRRHGTAVEKSCGGQGERARADRGDPRPAAVGEFEGREDLGGGRTAVVPVPRHDDGVRSRQRGQSGAHTHGEAGAGDHVAARGAADGHLVGSPGPGVEDLRGDAQVDGQHGGQCQDRDAMRCHGGNPTSVVLQPSDAPASAHIRCRSALLAQGRAVGARHGAA